MTQNTDLNANAELLHALAEKLGLPLDQMVAKGLMSDQVVGQMAENCASCASPAKCNKFLVDRPGMIEAPPSFCVNCRLLTFMSKSVVQKA